jgi:hypothetical protein
MYSVQDFLTQYKRFCQQKYPSDTGTAVSYTNAVKYLFEFMNATEISAELINEIKSLEPDIRDSDSVLYGELQNYFNANGRSSYLKKGFLKAALPLLFSFANTQIFPVEENDILIKEVSDNQIICDFSMNGLRHSLPMTEYSSHNYSVRRISGTADESARRICSGRKAEKYFTAFLTSIGFVKNVDFFDVANNKNYGYDIRFLEIGLEVKNIKSGGFYLSDNEIARLENTETHLILVDIDNGIWLLKNNSRWLKQTINNIKSLREYCKDNYKNIDVCDVRIIVNDDALNDVIDVANCNKEEFKRLVY